MTPPKYNYDHTSAQRQARRRTLFAQMRDALREIERTTTDDASRQIARAALREEKSSENVN